MRKNYMEKVAKMFGLELEETFRIDGKDGYFRLTNIGLVTKRNLESEDWYFCRTVMLHRLLIGENEVIKLPWKPRKGEEYYFPRPDTKALWHYDAWNENETDCHRFSHDLVFRTPREAAQKMMAAVQENKDE